MRGITYKTYKNENGPEIAVCSRGVIEKDGLVFRDTEGTGELLPYEDWRLTPEARAKDLASRLTIEEIAGLMMYSPHQAVPAAPHIGPMGGTYGGKNYSEAGAAPWAMTDQQEDFLKNNHIRFVLATTVESPEAAAEWNNTLQAFAETMPHSIPVNISSDPRNSVKDDRDVEFKGGANDISEWPEGLGMAAAFDPELVRKYAGIVSDEYRHLGITTALSPQADLGTDPRWMRFEDTFGPHPLLVRDYIRAYCDGFQTTEKPDGTKGWGRNSVACMVKHWPGGGTDEGGRDAHYPFGRFAVYPKDNMGVHLVPFLHGAFDLQEGTGQAASVMPYYTVSWNRDVKNHKNVGNSYSEFLIKDLLREKYGFDGVVCTDWGISGDPLPDIDSFSERCYGVEKLTTPERYLLLLENGVDQFGGDSKAEPILEAYRLACEKYGREAADARFRRSAARLLKNSFACGLFENPYVSPELSRERVGCRDYVEAGYEAQKRSIVMLKNDGALPVANAPQKVYIPTRTYISGKTFMRGPGAAPCEIDPMDGHALPEGFLRVHSPEEADLALVFMESPRSESYSTDDRAAGGNGYLPISLQYRPYKADTAREVSIAGGDFREPFTDRGYKGKSAKIYNEGDLDLLIRTKKAMGEKRVIACIRMHVGAVLSELEPFADGILVDFGVSKQALFEVITGQYEPTGLLPIQLPASMETVEAHGEDTPFDLEPYRDSIGHVYDFGFGLNFSGVIRDGRTERYTTENGREAVNLAAVRYREDIKNYL